MIIDNYRTLYNSDCRHMAELEDNSVQCVVTSPPYWGLRKYAGNQDLIWGGKPDCEHEWSGEKQIYQRGIVGNHSTLQGGSQRPESKNGSQSIPTGQSCSLCGAWHGAYGLEPTPDCGRPFMELRKNLTSEQLDYVMSELKKYGLI